MPIVTAVQVRQPVQHDLVAERFVVSGVGAGFEGTIGLRVLDSRTRELAAGFAQSAGGMAGLGGSARRWRCPHRPGPGPA